MINTCKLCGKQFEAKVYNNYICNEPHYINCRICNKLVYMNGMENKKKRKMYFDKGYVYCSHDCSCKGIGLDKYNKANEGVDLERLKYLRTQTNMFDTDIAKELGVSVDFVVDRCERNNWVRPEELKEELQENKNKVISNTLKQKYENEDAKNEMLQKARETYKARTGYDHNFKNPEEMKKYRQTKLERYGNENYTNIEKMKRTRKLKNKGVFWTDNQIEQVKQTKLKRYGISYGKVNLIKARQTKLERYGNETFTNTEKIKQTWLNKSESEKKLIVLKGKRTKLKKYGNENYNNSEKRLNTFNQKYKVSNYDYIHMNENTLDIILDKEKFRAYIKSIPFEQRTTKYFMQELNISQSAFNSIYHRYECEDINMNIFNSSFETEVKEFISSITDLKTTYNIKNIIPSMELDIYIRDINVAIECDGTYWHSLRYKPKTYHYNKSKLCEEKGIRLIHIYEHEWKNERQRPILENIIKNALGINQHKVYARKLDIEIRKSVDMREFFEKNNIQGFRGGKFAICLVDKETREVYMAYMMGNAYFGKGKYEWEVIRGATKLGYTVVGGASKIWKYFIENYNPKNCVYYIDYNYFNGNSMKNLPNMRFIKTQSSFKNFWVKTGEVKSREPIRHKKIKELEAQGLVIPIYNAGTKVYVWERD